MILQMKNQPKTKNSFKIGNKTSVFNLPEKLFSSSLPPKHNQHIPNLLCLYFTHFPIHHIETSPQITTVYKFLQYMNMNVAFVSQFQKKLQYIDSYFKHPLVNLVIE